AHVDVARHDPQHRLAGADHAGAVGSDQAGPPLLGVPPQIAFDPHHILGGNAVGDRHDEPDTCVRRLHDGIGAVRSGHQHQRGDGAGGRDRFLDGIEHRPLEVPGAALPRGHPAHHVRAVGDHLLRVERPLVPREPLDDDGGLLVEQDAHAEPAPPAGRAATTRSAASASVSAVMMGSPLSCRMRRPSSTFVPASRTTSGTGTRTSRTACTTPWATQSQRLMPANTFTRIARTFWSESTRRNAAATRSGDAPPPMSRKSAGSPPACWIMSSVAMASPAPLMMQPMSPSSPTYFSPCSAASAPRGCSSP